MTDSSVGRRALRKISWRLIPMLMAMFCVSFLDRVNIGFAALQMNQDLGLTPEAFGFAAGILFVSYTAFEIPSNLILDRVGPRRWLARIMVTWGIIAAATALVHDRESLYLARLLLGAAEAGFFPGVLVYISRWFPQQERARAITLFMVGSPLSVFIGAPLSSALLSMRGNLGLGGWQWLFVLEALPAVVLGLLALRVLTERPDDALWLSGEERDWLTAQLREEGRAKRAAGAPSRVIAVFTHVPTLLLALSKLCVLLAFFGITLWLPQIVHSVGHLSPMQTGLLTALPYGCAAIGSVWVGRSSDRRGERGLHIALPAFFGAIAFAAAGATMRHPLLAMAALCIAATGLWISNTVFWTLPTALLAGTPAAAGLALINSVGNIGGFIGPLLTGWVRARSGGYAIALVVLGGILAVSGLLVMWVSKGLEPAHGYRPPEARLPSD